jgi:hypothetical protein
MIRVILEAADKGGIWLAVLVAIVVSFIALLLVYTRAEVPIVGVQAPATTEQHIVAATGAEGFPVEAFCKDAATQVKALPNPDASGITYQLLRTRDNVPEAVIWAAGLQGDNLSATHYWFDDQHVQQSEPAVVTPGARRCIEGKAP